MTSPRPCRTSYSGYSGSTKIGRRQPNKQLWAHMVGHDTSVERSNASTQRSDTKSVESELLILPLAPLF